MPQIIQQTVYTYDELSTGAKEKVQQWWSETLDSSWHEFLYEDFMEIGMMLGVDIDDIYYTGFHNQGDGACFTGYYSVEPDAVTKIKGHAPKDEELHRIAESLTASQMTCKLQHNEFMRCNLSHHGRYYHEQSITFDFDKYEDDFDELADLTNIQDSIEEALRDLMRWMYNRLEEEYEYQISDEYIGEACKGNDYKFYEDGTFYQ